MSDDHSEIPEHLQGSALSLEATYQSIFHQSPLLSPHARLAFETLETLGKGGMGTVYAVRDRRLDREAALKLLLHSNADLDARKRFLREAKITAKLDHPAIPPVYETGLTPDGQLYMLMKRIRGRTLGECIRECHDDELLTLNELILVLIKVAEAVAYAHRKGIIHRDLKPDNIMVGEFGEVLLIDWGIAKDLHSLELGSSQDLYKDSFFVSEEELQSVGVTASGSLVGTPGYMAPEQIEGGNVDFRVDIFALGANLIEIITGEKAVLGGSAIEKIAVTISDSVSLPQDLDPAVSRELNWIAARATQFVVSQRTKSAEDFVQQLKAYLAGRPIPGYQYSLRERMGRSLRKNATLAMGIMVGALMLALTGNLWLTLKLEGEKRLLAEKEILAVNDKLDVAEDEAKQAKDVLALQNAARSLAQSRVTKARLVTAVEAVLARGDRSEDQLLTAAEIYQLGRCPDMAIPLAEEAVRRFPPCYRGLFLLHSLSLGNERIHSRGSAYLIRLIEEAEKRGDVNEYLLFSRGVTFQNEGAIDEALKAYAEAEKFSRSIVNLYNNRAIIWKNKKQFEKAFTDYDRCIELDPDYAAAYYNRGLLLKDLRKFDRAMIDFKTAIQLDPGAANSYTELAKIYVELGDLDKGLSYFDKAITLEPNNSELHCYRGITYSRKGARAKAARDFDRSIEIDPNSWLGYYNRAGLSLKSQNYKVAIRDLNQAIKIDSSPAVNYAVRGRCFQQLGDSARAIADFNKALGINKKLVDTYFYRGVTYHESGKIDLAFQDYSRVVELDPNYYNVYYNRGILWKNQGEIDKALGQFNKAVELRPQKSEPYLYRGRLYVQQGLLDLALSDFNMVIKLSPRFSQGYYERSTIFRRQGKNQLALDDLNLTIQLNPNWAQPYGSRATLRQNLKQFDKALDDINLALNKKIGKPIAYCVRAEIYSSLGRKAEAIADYKTFLRLSPKHSDRAKVERIIRKLEALKNN